MFSRQASIALTFVLAFFALFAPLALAAPIVSYDPAAVDTGLQLLAAKARLAHHGDSQAPANLMGKLYYRRSAESAPVAARALAGDDETPLKRSERFMLSLKRRQAVDA